MSLNINLINLINSSKIYSLLLYSKPKSQAYALRPCPRPKPGPYGTGKGMGVANGWRPGRSAWA